MRFDIWLKMERDHSSAIIKSMILINRDANPRVRESRSTAALIELRAPLMSTESSVIQFVMVRSRSSHLGTVIDGAIATHAGGDKF